MNFYDDIESAVMEVLQAADCAGSIRTWEDELREVMFTGGQLSKGFTIGELPAVMVTLSQDPVKSYPSTSGEITYDIPIQVLVVTCGVRREAARADLAAMLRSFERSLHQARRSDGLGYNAFIHDDLLSSFVLIHDRPQHFAVGNITAIARKVVEL